MPGIVRGVARGSYGMTDRASVIAFFNGIVYCLHSDRLGGHIGQADNYVPRQLTPEAHAALKSRMQETGKFS